ncbi:hypothetical protein GCM10027184_71980 [Saccharothrix stipae]
MSPTAEALNAVRVAWAVKNAVPLAARPPWRWMSLAPTGDIAISTDAEARSSSVWKVERGTASHLADVPAEGRVSMISRSGGVFLLTDDQGATQVWTIAEPSAPRRLDTIQHAIVQTMSDSGRVLAGVGMRREPRRFDHPANVLSGNGIASMWRQGDDGRISEVPLPGMRVESVALRGDARAMVTVSLSKDYFERYVELWHLDEGGSPTRAGPMLVEQGQVRAVFSPDGRFLALVNETAKTIDVLDVADPSAPRHWARLTDLSLSELVVDFAADNAALAIGGRPELVQVWDIATPGEPRQVAAIEGLPAAVDYSHYHPASRELTVSDPAGTQWRFDLDDARLLGEACAWPGVDDDDVSWHRTFPGVEQRSLCP